ncbi:MAG: hypothetical protein ABIJ09_12195 [Pseudomonadota bacterium]
MAARKTTKKAPSRSEATPYDLTEPVHLRLSLGIMEYVDWYANLLSEREQVSILRPEAIRRMVLYAGRALKKAEGVE